jgi:hypothetical protein
VAEDILRRANDIAPCLLLLYGRLGTVARRHALPLHTADRDVAAGGGGLLAAQPGKVSLNRFPCGLGQVKLECLLKLANAFFDIVRHWHLQQFSPGCALANHAAWWYSEGENDYRFSCCARVPVRISGAGLFLSLPKVYHIASG